jgi:hypothetical protein
MKIDQEIRLLKEQVRALSQRIEQRPVVQTVKLQPNQFILITGGNVLTGGEQGIKFIYPNITSVPSAYDPNVTTSFIDGIGRGRLYRDGVLQTDYVLVVNDSRGTFQQALLTGDVLYTTGSVLISAPGGAFVTAYTMT